MAETLGTLPPDPTDAVPNYRPISGLAIAAIFLSGAFAAIVVILGLSALVTHKPVLAPWALALGVVGLILAVAARFQIRRSEGTRVGLKLANTAWWLSILFIVGYGAYFAAFDYAVRSQSRYECTEPYLNLLRDTGDPTKSPKEQEDALRQAFMWNLQPAQRQGLKPEAIDQRFEQSYKTFCKGDLIHLLQRAGGQMRIEDVSVSDWSAKGTGYDVTQTVLMRTPEGLFQLEINALGSEGAGLSGRQWNIVPMPNSPIRSAEPTELGELVVELIASARQAARRWGGSLSTGDGKYAYLMSLAPDHREQLRKQSLARAPQVRAVHLAAFLADPLHLYATFLWQPQFWTEVTTPGFNRFITGHRPNREPWIDFPPKVAPTGQYETTARHLLLPGGITLGASGAMGPPTQPYPTFAADHFSVHVPITCMLTSFQSSDRLFGWLTVETHDSELVRRLNALRGQGLDLPLRSETTAALTERVNWQIGGVQVYTEETPRPKGGGPPQPTQLPPQP